MLQLLVTALTSKAAVAVAIGTLAAGTAAAAAPVLTGGGRPDVVPPKAAEVLDVEAADNATSAAASDERPEAATFGASVAEDARDGGVDGQEISERARQRNDERREARGAGDGHDGPPAERGAFGASVAEDAPDGGVDGQEISERARDRNPGTADDDQDDDQDDDDQDD